MTTTPERFQRSVPVLDADPDAVTGPARRPPPRPLTDRGRRRTAPSVRRTAGSGSGILLAVVLGLVCLCLLVSHLTRFYAYDEAIYLSQVFGGKALPFTAPRARGLTWLVAPLGAIGAPVAAVRGYLLLVNAGLMFIGFRSWLPVIGRRAVVAAAAFGLCWPALFEATEVFPNLPAALLGVTAAGYLAQAALGLASRWSLLLAGLAVALMTTIRPTEGTFLTAGLLAAAVVVPRSGRPAHGLGRRAAALLAGLAIGWLPWLIEAQARFGGPAQRLRAAAQNVAGGLHPANLIEHLRLTDGPLAGPGTGAVPLAGVAWWSVLAAGPAITVGVTLAGRFRRRRAQDAAVPPGAGARLAGGAVAGLAGTALAVQYLLLAGVIEARFLLPAYALLTLAAASLLPGVSRVRSTHAGTAPGVPVVAVVAVTVVMAAVAAFGGWQVHTVTRIEHEQQQARAISRALGAVLTDHATRKPCFFASQAAFPVIGFASGCQGARLDPASPIVYLHDDPGSSPVFGLSASDPRAGLVRPVAGSALRLRSAGARSWWLFEIPRSAVVITK